MGVCDSDDEPVEVEQLLPPIGPVHNPQDLYASDSPVMEDPHSDEEQYKLRENNGEREDIAESVDLDGQSGAAANGSNSGLHVCFLDLTKCLPLLTSLKRPRSFRPPQHLSSKSKVSQASGPSFSRVSRSPPRVSLALPRNLYRADQSERALGCSSVCGPLCGVVQLIPLFLELQ
jgi:hypothetical protein